MRKDMPLSKRLIPVIWAARTWFLFQGISTSLVLATVNGYLKSFGAHADYMGYVMAGYAFGGIIAAPLFGKIADQTKNAKIVLLLSIGIQIISYILYLYFQNENIILLARILAGIGFGADGAIVGEVSRNLNEEEAPRTIDAVFYVVFFFCLPWSPWVNFFYIIFGSSINP